MDFERALEKQRLALLRLLTGLMAVVVLASFAPAVSLMPNWVRGAASTLLMRIESAVDSLVYVAATVFCGYRGTVTSLGAVTVRDDVLPDDGFSTETLLRRIAAVRAVLANLPRFAKRLIRRLSRTRGTAPKVTWPLECAGGLFPVPIAPTRIDRPPD